jgi:predicted transcriptional regulator of viral defense system
MTLAERGLHPETRARLETLHRALHGPFDAAAASRALALDHPRTRRVLGALYRAGWLSRVRPGLYVTVPLGATRPSDWREDPWLVASTAFAPCYVGGFSAAHHWGLTEQLFRTVVALTAKPVRHRKVVLQGAPYLLKHRRDAGKWGVRKEWRGGVSVLVSDASLTLIDTLDDPSIGGGVRHIAECLQRYWDEHRAPELLLAYAQRLGNRTVYKRLGYLAEALQLSESGALIDACRKHLSKGLSRLDPAGPVEGKVVTRFGLLVNVHVAPS